MKKFLTICAAFLALLPLTFLAGCKNTITAEFVKNRSFFVTAATKNVETNQDALDGDLQIHFFDENFLVEFKKNTSGYGFYIGTFTAKGGEVTLSVTEKSGTFKDGIPSEFDLSSHPLKFDGSTLKTEFVCAELVIVKYTFSTRE